MHLPRLRVIFPALAALLASALHAQVTVTWINNSYLNGGGTWTNTVNWSPGIVPGANDTAYFTDTGPNYAELTNSDSVSLGTLHVASGAGAVTFFLLFGSLDFYGAGIVNDSSTAVEISSGGASLTFHNTSSAGLTHFDNSLYIRFTDNSNAGHLQYQGGDLSFDTNATAGNATITVVGGLTFSDHTSAGSATLINTNTSGIAFVGNSTAGSAQITNNAFLGFYDNATGGSAAITNGQNGETAFYTTLATQSLGSLAGDGSVRIPGVNLSIGSLNTDTVFTGWISDEGTPGTLTKVGTGTLTLANINGFAFAHVNGGTLALASGATLGYNDGTVQASVDNGATLELGGNTVYLNQLTLTNGTVRNGTIDASTGGVTLNTGTVSAVLAGTNAVDKTGSGTVSLTANNTYSGGTNITGGLIEFSSAANFGSGTINLDGGGLRWATSNTSDITAWSSLNHTVGAGGATFDTNGNNITFTAGFDGSGALTKTGAGTLTLASTATNTNTGGTNITGGVIEFSSAANFGSGTIDLDGGSLRWATGNTADITAQSPLNIGAGGATFDTNGNNVTFTVGVGGTGAFTKAGSGRIVLTDANTNTGGTNVSAGSLRLAAGGALGSGAVTVASGAALWFQDSTTAGSAAIANSGATYFDNTASAGSATITGSGSTAFYANATASHATLSTSGFTGFYDNATADHATIVTSGNTNFQDNATAGSATITNNGFMGFLANSTAGSATITNNNNLTLRGNSPGGATIVNHGTLGLYSTGGTPTISNDGTILITEGGTAAGASITNGATGGIALYGLTNPGAAIGALAGSGNVYLNDKTLTVGARNLDTVFSGVIQEGGNLVKTGTGRLTLAADNTYGGDTTIQAGTLQLGADSALGNGNLILAGGTLDLANFSQTAGTLTVTGHSFIDFGALTSTLFLTQSDALTWSGRLTVLNFTNGSDLFRIGTDANGLTADQLGRIDFDGFAALMDTSGYLTAGATAAVPEPSAYVVLAGLGALGFVLVRRRRF